MTINKKEPIFTYPIVSVKDGGSKLFTGISYTVHKQIHNAFTEEEYFTYSLFTWFFDLLCEL